MKTTRCSGEWISVTEHARVLGIDPGTRIAGYAVIDFNARGDSTLIDAGVLRLSATAPLAARIRQLFDDVTALLQEHSPTHMALEAVFSHADHARERTEGDIAVAQGRQRADIRPDGGWQIAEHRRGQTTDGFAE